VTGENKQTSKLSREHHIETSSSGLITVTGGKWTTYRRMAEATLSFAMRNKMLPERPCRTMSTRLHGAPAAVSDEDEQEDSLSRYGSDARQVRNLLNETPALGRKIDEALPFTFAEVVYAVRSEMARTVEDVLSRRTRALLLNAEAARRAAPAVARTMAEELGASSEWVSQQVAAFDLLALTYYLQTPVRQVIVSADSTVEVGA
jgi:glycerol-3-phosphate dehydrogenase